MSRIVVIEVADTDMEDHLRNAIDDWNGNMYGRYGNDVENHVTITHWTSFPTKEK